MLRNEKPVMFNWSADNQSAQITTGKEPVGEEGQAHRLLLCCEKARCPKKCRKDCRKENEKINRIKNVNYRDHDFHDYHLDNLF